MCVDDKFQVLVPRALPEHKFYSLYSETPTRRGVERWAKFVLSVVSILKSEVPLVWCFDGSVNT